MKNRLSWPSPALVLSMVALLVAVGGTAYAASQITSKQIKNNTIKSVDVKKNGLKGSDIKESTLGKVPKAGKVSSVVGFSKGANEDSAVSLVKTSHFELYGVCDTDGTYSIPPSKMVLEDNGSQTLSSTTYVIVNRASAPAFSDSSDDEDYKLEKGEGIAFNYHDNGDGGSAFLPSGRFMMVPGWGSAEMDKGYYVDSPNPDDDPTGFSKDCQFSGAVLVG